MTDRPIRATILLSIVGTLAVVLLLAVASPAMGYAAGVNELPMAEMSDDDGLDDPTADAWNDVEERTVVLSSAESGLPGAADTTVGLIGVETAHTDERIHMRISWDAPSPSETIDDPRAFADAVAVQLPLQQAAEPPIAMGSETEPVDVWYWNADTGEEELYAGGMGSTTAMSESAVSTQATHTDGEWRVVFTRELAAGDRERTDIDTDEDLNVAFAVFDGTNHERAGVKAASEWYHYPLSADAGPSVLEILLWAVAGLAIVAVVVVTVSEIRKEDR